MSVATPSNCGNILIALSTKHGLKESCGRGNDLGYGKNGRDRRFLSNREIGKMDNPQPSPKS